MQQAFDSCAGCGALFVAHHRLQLYCEDRCKWMAKSQKRGPTCRLCGKQMHHGSLPQGQATCHGCRRALMGRAPDERLSTKTPGMLTNRTCPVCRAVYVPRRSNQRYCSWRCRDAHGFANGHRFRNIKKAPTTARGYGIDHVKARRQAAARHRPTDPCARCRQPLGPMSRYLHYDHDGTRTGYLGFSHARCNIRAGALLGNHRANAATTSIRPLAL